MRYLNTVYVRNHRARVRHRRGSLVVSSPEGSQRVPLEAVDALVILGGGQITTQALDACVKRGVRVSALRKSGAIRFVVGHQTGGNVHLRTALYRAVTEPDHSLELARSIVAAKLQNSRTVLGRWARDEDDAERSDYLASRAEAVRACVARVTDASTPDHLRGIEGDAARTHFHGVSAAVALCDLQFAGRNRRPPRDPVNAMLGFCYGLLTGEYIGAIESVGLDFQMGFFHRPRSGRPSLALDLAEELRPVTDRFVVSLVRRRQLGTDDFVDMPGGAVYLTDDGRDRLIRGWEEHKETEFLHPVVGRRVGRWALPSVQATLLARHLRGDIASYPPFVVA